MGTAVSVSLKLVATPWWECARERKTWVSESRVDVAALNTKWKKKWMILKMLPQWGIFQGFFLTMHLASCYSFKHTLNSCFVLCCKQFLKKDAICLCIKTRGMLTRAVSPFCLLKETRLTLCIVQYMETTQDMFIPQINIEIFFSLTSVSFYFFP